MGMNGDAPGRKKLQSPVFSMLLRSMGLTHGWNLCLATLCRSMPLKLKKIYKAEWRKKELPDP
jgi:hypothetical protein